MPANITQRLPAVENRVDGSQVFRIGLVLIGLHPGGDHRRARPWELHPTAGPVPIRVRVPVKVARLLIRDVVIPQSHRVLLQGGRV